MFARRAAGDRCAAALCRVVAGQPDSAQRRRRDRGHRAATAAVAAGEAAALVTNPIAKSVLYDAGFAHPGHTEFLAELAERHFPGRRYTSVMMLAPTSCASCR